MSHAFKSAPTWAWWKPSIDASLECSGPDMLRRYGPPIAAEKPNFAAAAAKLLEYFSYEYYHNQVLPYASAVVDLANGTLRSVLALA